MKNLRILLFFIVLLTMLLTACGTSLQPTPTATETPLPTLTFTPANTHTPTITYTPRPTDTPTISPSPTIEPSPTIPAEWMNWKGDVKDFDSYILINQIRDLDRIIDYDRTHDTTEYPSKTICDIKLVIPKPGKVIKYSRLEFEKKPKDCTLDILPAREILGAQLEVNNSQIKDTLLFIVQKRYTSEGPIYIKYVASKTYIDRSLKTDEHKYYTKIFGELSERKIYIVPIVEYISLELLTTGSLDYLQEALKSIGYTYDKSATKDILTQWASYSQENKAIPQELREKIGKSIFFFAFNIW
jgi:hypothetical protein